MEMEPKPTYPLPSTEVLEGFSHAIHGVLYHFETAADGRWRFLYLSSRVEALYGVAPDEAYKDADCLTRCILAEDRIANRSSFEAACKSLTPWAHEHRIETPSGERKWVRAQATPHPQPDGSIQWFGILTDITASRRIENALRDREAQYRRLLSNLKAGVVVHGPDTRILLSNAEANRLLGLERHEILGKAATTLEWSFVHEDGSCMRPTEYPVNRVLATHQPVRGQLVGINRPGQADRTWVMVNAFPEDDDNGVLRSVVVTFVDLTERIQIHKQLQESESLTRSILDALPESMVVLDRQGVIVQANKAWTRLAREGGADARIQNPIGIDYGAVCRGVVEPGEKSESMYAWEGICAVQRGDRPEFTHQYRCETPTKTKWFRMRVIPLGNVPHPGVVVAHEDITERVELEAHLQALATTDDMTDLSNRRHFLAQLAAEHERLQRQVGEHSAVLMLDLDRFKAANDSHGHEGGDAVIRHIAGMIRDALRKIDQAGRLGGEEFAILLTGADGEAAQTFAERLRLRVAQTPAMYRRQPIPMTLSIGITPLTAADTNIDEVLRRADTALYQAKAAGRDSVVVAPQQCSE